MSEQPTRLEDNAASQTPWNENEQVDLKRWQDLAKKSTLTPEEQAQLKKSQDKAAEILSAKPGRSLANHSGKSRVENRKPSSKTSQK